MPRFTPESRTQKANQGEAALEKKPFTEASVCVFLVVNSEMLRKKENGHPPHEGWQALLPELFEDHHEYEGVQLFKGMRQDLLKEYSNYMETHDSTLRRYYCANDLL